MGKIKNAFATALNSLLDILFPPVCVICGENAGGREVICRRCFENIPLNGSLFCGRCRARLPENKKICHKDFPYILGIAASYNNPCVNSLVRELKFKFVKSAAVPLAELLISYAGKLGFPGSEWLVVPVPLGKKRLRRRGFNQAELIAEIFSKKYSLEIEKTGLSRNRETKPQSDMKALEMRLENVKECFLVISPEKFAGRDIILIDDVSTSGSTFLEAASSLRKAGARKIIALAAAGS